ncbi:hypothetical protein [Lacrimispora brassicae]
MMKRSKALSSCLIIFACFLFLATACKKQNLEKDDESGNYVSNELSAKDDFAIEYTNELANEYTISFYNSSRLSHLPWSNDFSFDTINVQNMFDTSLQDRINENIRQAMTSWIEGKVVNATSVDLYIYCHNEKYLSFANSFEYSDRRLDYIKDYITIDMKTGNRVMLNNLVRIDAEFVEHIQKTNLVKESINSMAYGGAEGNWEYLNKFTIDELINELEECSYTQKQVIQEGYATVDESLGPLILRKSFYLRDGKLVIVLDYDKHITLNLDDISDFLKVEKW